MQRRIGKFSISRRLIEDAPDTCLLVMAKVIVIRAEMLFESNSVEYVALSQLFDEVPQDCESPTYRVMVNLDDIVTFERV